MAKKRNTNAAIKALKRKRHNKTRANYEAGGRVQKFYGGPLNYRTIEDGNYSSTAQPVMDGGGRGPAGDNTQQTSTTRQASTPEPTPPPAFGTGTEPYTPPKAEIVKAGQSFDHTLLDDALMQTKAFKEGSVSATYNPDTGKYTLTAFGVTSEKTPEEMADYAGGRTIADFQSDDPSLQTGEESIKQVAGPADVTATSVAAQDITAKTATAEEATSPAAVTAETYQASQVGDVGATKVARGTLSEDAKAKVDPITGLTQEAEAVTMTQQEMEDLKGTAATRPEAKDYADAVTTDERFTVGDVTGPGVTTRDGIEISDEERARLREIAKGRGVALEDLPEFKKNGAKTGAGW